MVKGDAPSVVLAGVAAAAGEQRRAVKLVTR
jgi:hypothetical protein